MRYYKDPHIKSYRDPAPFIPGTATRYRWPRTMDREVTMIRRQVQNSGEGLYILRPPHDQPYSSILVEAYYPFHIRDDYVEWLDPFRREDMRNGNLVVVAAFDGVHGPEIKPPEEQLNRKHIMEIRRNNREARRHLRRKSTAKQRKREIRDNIDQQDEEVYSRWDEIVDEATRDTRKFGMATRVGPSTSTFDSHS